MGQVNNIENIIIDKLVPYANNSKKHPKRQLELLEKSINEFGFITPCLIDENNNLIAGHGRLEAAKRIGYTEVPCVRVEGLTDEQRKAYIIADNKIAGLGEWDYNALQLELEQLSVKEFDLDLTGFDYEQLNVYQTEKLAKDYYGDERERTNKSYNLDIASEFDSTDNFWEMPIIKATNHIPSKMIGFNYAKTSNDYDACIHFFIDDYQFERIWNNPEKYAPILNRYDSVLTPDFSLYMDMPIPMKIWNVYRSRCVGAYYQSRGINVIPTLSWAEKKTFDFAFSGVEKNGVVAVSTVGVKENKDALDIWRDGMEYMIGKIKPKAILVYGGEIDFDYGSVDVIYYKNEVLEGWKNGR